MSPTQAKKPVMGWGRTTPTNATIVRPSNEAELSRVFDAPPGTNVIARGLGRSYGDAAQCGGGLVIDSSAFDRIGPIDANRGLVTVGGGVSLQTLIARSLPLGWFVAVTPGTQFVSVGVAIASDVHGKNHHRDGSFAHFVQQITLATPTGVHEVAPDKDPELFWATCGGMGLTGVVIEAVLQLIPVETPMVSVDTQRFEHLADLMAVMEASDGNYRYSVAWLDCLPHRHARRRSVLTRGNHATKSQLPKKHGHDRDAIPGARLRLPGRPPRTLVTRASVRALNEVWFRKTPRLQYGALQPMNGFFYPLDDIESWNLLYGPKGFVQYQMTVGSQKVETIESTLEAIDVSGVVSSLAVLKRFGPGNEGPLSFPQEGWTLALDFPVGPTMLPTLLDDLDGLVAGAGGRVYLSKDARLRPELLPVMYPRLGELEAVRQRIDPTGIVESDLSRRLGLTMDVARG